MGSEGERQVSAASGPGGRARRGGVVRSRSASTVVYCSGRAHALAEPTGSDRRPHLRRHGRAGAGRGVDRRAPGAGQSPRPRLSRRHPHSPLLGLGEVGLGRSQVPGDRRAGDAGHRAARRRAGFRPGGGAPGHGAGHRQGQGRRAQRGGPRQCEPRGPAGRLCGDGHRPGPGRHAVGQRRERPQRGALGRRGAASRHQSPRHRGARPGRSGDAPGLRHQRGRRGQAQGQEEPQAAGAARLVHRCRGPPGHRPRGVLRRSARRSPRRGRAQGLRALAGRGDPRRHSLGQRHRRPGDGPALQRHPHDLSRRRALRPRSAVPRAGPRAPGLGALGLPRRGRVGDPRAGPTRGAAGGAAAARRHSRRGRDLVADRGGGPGAPRPRACGVCAAAGRVGVPAPGSRSTYGKSRAAFWKAIFSATSGGSWRR